MPIPRIEGIEKYWVCYEDPNTPEKDLQVQPMSGSREDVQENMRFLANTLSTPSESCTVVAIKGEEQPNIFEILSALYNQDSLTS